MIEYNSKSALLEIPKGLGNFAENGSGGGQDIGPLSGSVVELSATTVGIETNLGNLSGSTETLQQDLGELSGTTDSIGDAVADLLLDVDDLDTRVSGNTENIETLSGITSGISQNVEALSGVTSGLSGNIMELSGVTSGLAVDIETLSGNVKNTVFWDVAAFEDMSYPERKVYWDEVYAKVASGYTVIAFAYEVNKFDKTIFLPLERYMAETNPSTHTGGYFYFVGKSVDANKYYDYSVSSTGNVSGVGSSDTNAHKFEPYDIYSLPTASSSTLGGVKVGTGLTIDSGGTLTLDGMTFAMLDLTDGGMTIPELFSAITSTYEVFGKQIVLRGRPNTVGSDTLFLPLVTRTITLGVVKAYNFQGQYNDPDGIIHTYYVSVNSDGTTSGTVTTGGVVKFKEKSAISAYSLPTASSSTKGGVKVGSGLTINSEKLSVAIGEGLAYSGNTIVVSGGTGGGPAVYVLNNMSQAERLALYNELTPYRDTSTYIGVQSGFPAQDYAFYFWAGDESSEGWNDGARGFVPMQLTAIHPDDYGGACFFTGTVKSRQGNNETLWVRYVITSTGEADKSTGRINWDNPVGYFYIYSDGTVPQDTDRYSFQGKDVIMIRCGDWNRGWVESLSFTNDYSVLHIKGKIQIDGVEYAGYWTCTDGQAEPWSKVSFTAV